MSKMPSKLQREVARTIVSKYLQVKDGENVTIESWEHTMPLARAMLDEVRRAGGKALFVYNDEDSYWRSIDRKQSKLLGQSSDPEWAALKETDVYVNFWGPADTDRMERFPESDENAFDWLWPWYAVARRAGLRGVRMTTGFVTEKRARQWGLDFGKWEDSMLRASLVDPEELIKRGSRLQKALLGGRRVRITHPNGTDLEVALARQGRLTTGRASPFRKGDPASGMLQQVPGGTLDVALDSKTAEGRFRANRRTNIWWNVHAGGTLEFSDGKLSSYTLEVGEKEFGRQYKTGTAGKDRTSLLKFGVNPAVKDVPNLETVEGGSVSLQIGGNGFVHGTNKSSFFSWFSLAGAEISVDGTPVVRGGKVL